MDHSIDTDTGVAIKNLLQSIFSTQGDSLSFGL